MVSLTLDDSTKAVIRSTWAAELKIPVALLKIGGLKVIERNESTWVVVLKLDDSQVVISPSVSYPFLSQLDADQLLELNTLIRVLSQFDPRPVGSAFLLFSQGNSFELVEDQSVRTATNDEVDQLLESCSRIEGDESGLKGMQDHFVVSDSTGKPIAIAGYEIWNETIAHMGVLVEPSRRGQGLGVRVAKSAAHSARTKSLVLQWRVRTDNTPSNHLAARLGFVQMGQQLALQLTVLAPNG
jgi:N-acetylglutamate synthase-like GNAT family acetyltransferase